jgi:hypothetical protein
MVCLRSPGRTCHTSWLPLEQERHFISGLFLSWSAQGCPSPKDFRHHAFKGKLISLAYSRELASGAPLARGLCAFISIFWGIRLVIQCFVFDAKPYLKTFFLKAGYHGLTAVFAWHTLVYGIAALS